MSRLALRCLAWALLGCAMVSAQATQPRHDAAEGRFVRGDAADTLRGQSRYEGRFAHVEHPFTKERLVVYTSGRYTTAVGVVFDGEFEFLPVRDKIAGQPLGVYVFVGARIDRELDEVRQGLFISEAVGPSQNIPFSRARPDYLAHLQAEFMAQVAAVASEKAAQQAADETRRAAFGLFIDVVSGVANVRAVRKGGSVNPLTRDALSALRGAVTGEQTPEAAMNQLMGSLAGRLSSKVSGATLPATAQPGDMSTALRALGRQMARQTLQQYEDSLRQSAAPGTPER